MMTETTFFPPFPVDVRSLWDINGKSAETTYRAWLETVGQMQTETIQFLNIRIAKNAALLARLGQCRTPADVFNVQADYASHAFIDFVNEGQKVAARFEKVAAQGMFAQPIESTPKSSEGGSPKRRGHRSGTH
jgi:hypothetical protein